ncbi:hypothetical protein [Pedobacter agri]|uniref:hypothetical protein n=1 Tax=Pedobacter agri TaxID=454586 RepID=UPI002930B195|nr:hypothetical protein [Pedobacter agri]
MSLIIDNLEKNGNASKEYLLLKAADDVDLSSYAVVDRTYKNGQVSNIHKHFYHFPSKKVKKGEYVSLRTEKGKDETVNNPKLGVVHRFYWGSGASIWNDSEIEEAELLKISSVATVKA